jgi:hypothetical protein
MKRFAVAALLVSLGGCASTTVDVSGPGAGRPVCLSQGSTLVLWTTNWRPDQKDVANREAAAGRGLQQFFVHSGCPVEIRKAASSPAVGKAYDQIIVVTVRELGPVVRIGSPSVVEGGTEVVLETKILDGGTGKVLADLHTHWQNGGAFVLKGVATLEQDMTKALEETFKPRS